MMWQTRERFLGLAVSTLLAVACAGQSAARRDQVQMLQRIALEEAKSGQATSARSLLLEAERIGVEAGLEADPLVTRTRMALGAIYANNFKDEQRGVSYMKEALAKNPQAKLPSGMASPLARRALALARGRVPEGEGSVEPVAGSGFAEEAAGGASDSLAEAAGAAADTEGPLDATVESAPEADALNCPIPLETPPQKEVVLRCNVPPEVRATRLVLHYRPAGTETFSQVAMPRVGRGQYQGVVPASATTGKSLQFFVEARGPVKLNNGSPESPNLLIVREGAPPVGGGLVAAVAAVAAEPAEAESSTSPPADEVVKTSRENQSVDGENPLAALDAARQLSLLRRRPAGRFWAAFGLGTGYGWQPGGYLEFRREREISSGSLPGGVMIMPEVGYQLMDHLSVSMQLRVQYVPITGSGDPLGGTPANRASAILARGTYTFGDGRLQPMATACIGGGDGFRLRVPNDRGVELVRSDTVRGGPLVAGAGGGVVYNITQRLAWPSEARVLLGFPVVGALFEIGTGIAYTF
jgi:hypothetical protein